MIFRVCAIGYVIFHLYSPVFAHSNFTKACEAVFDPEAMKISCCDPMDTYVKRMAECRKESCTDELTCTVSKCVINEYGGNITNTIDEARFRAIIKKLCKENPEARPLNKNVLNNCLDRQYRKYVSSDSCESACDAYSYQICAHVNYLMGCQKFRKSPCSCKTLAENVKTCKPFLQQYLKQLNNNS